MKRLISVIIYCFMGIGFMDQALNMIAAHKAFHEVGKASLKMADWFTKNTKPNSIVVTNFENGFDISFLSEFYVINLWAIHVPGADVFLSSLMVEEDASFKRMLHQNYGKREIYLIEQKPGRNKYVDKYRVMLVPIAEFKVDAQYLFLDPLKNFIPRVSFPGPPGLKDRVDKDSFDIVTGVFKRKFSADYYLYKLI